MRKQNLLESAKQALEVLDDAKVWCSTKIHNSWVKPRAEEAITNLRAAIEEAEKQEPVLGVHIEGGECAYTTFVRFDRVAVDGYYELFTHPAQIPEGWQLVPKEPTEEMLIAAQKAEMDHSDFDDWLEFDGGDCLRRYKARRYKAMLAAAPKP